MNRSLAGGMGKIRTFSFQHPSISTYQPHLVERRHQRASSANQNTEQTESAKKWKCPLNSSQIKVIDDNILNYFRLNSQTSTMFKKKMQLRDALYMIMKDIFPYCGLYVVGSSMNGFGNDSSDMDMCLLVSHYEIDQQHEAAEILHVVCSALRKCSFLRDVFVIRAKVPILRFVDNISGIECDINVNNLTGILNTHLLHAYSQVDSRVRELVLYAKFWAKAFDINDASKSTLSSYSLVLMVLHFLQCGTVPSVLPCLQRIYPQRFSVTADIRQLALNGVLPDHKSLNVQSVGELFVGFLHYYSSVFDFDRDAISVRNGQRLPRELVTRQNPILNPPGQWKEICIEEPFNLSNTARAVYHRVAFQQILTAFQRSYEKLSSTGDLDALFS